MLEIRVAFHPLLLDPDALCWAVAPARTIRRRAVNLVDHRVVNVGPKGSFYCFQIGAVAV